MSRPRFLTDQDFNELIERGVLRREPAVEFLHLRDVGMETASDPDVLAYAAAGRWIVLSHDVNTMTAAARDRLAAGQPLSGLLLVRQRALPGPIIDSLILIWAASEAEEWVDQVRFLPV